MTHSWERFQYSLLWLMSVCFLLAAGCASTPRLSPAEARLLSYDIIGQHVMDIDFRLRALDGDTQVAVQALRGTLERARASSRERAEMTLAVESFDVPWHEISVQDLKAFIELLRRQRLANLPLIAALRPLDEQIEASLRSLNISDHAREAAKGLWPPGLSQAYIDWLTIDSRANEALIDAYSFLVRHRQRWRFDSATDQVVFDDSDMQAEFEMSMDAFDVEMQRADEIWEQFDSPLLYLDGGA